MKTKKLKGGLVKDGIIFFDENDERLKYDGEIRNDKPHGKGTLYYRDENKEKVEGFFENGELKKESVKKESVKKESAKKDSVKKESVKKESVKKESAKNESAKKSNTFRNLALGIGIAGAYLYHKKSRKIHRDRDRKSFSKKNGKKNINI
jgi:hypothetical protein